MKEKEMVKVAKWINDAISQVQDIKLPQDKAERSAFYKKFKAEIYKNKNLLQIAKEVKTLCLKFPLP